MSGPQPSAQAQADQKQAVDAAVAAIRAVRAISALQVPACLRGLALTEVCSEVVRQIRLIEATAEVEQVLRTAGRLQA